MIHHKPGGYVLRATQRKLTRINENIADVESRRAILPSLASTVGKPQSSTTFDRKSNPCRYLRYKPNRDYIPGQIGSTTVVKNIKTPTVSIAPTVSQGAVGAHSFRAARHRSRQHPRRTIHEDPPDNLRTPPDNQWRPPDKLRRPLDNFGGPWTIYGNTRTIYGGLRTICGDPRTIRDLVCLRVRTRLAIRTPDQQQMGAQTPPRVLSGAHKILV